MGLPTTVTVDLSTELPIAVLKELWLQISELMTSPSSTLVLLRSLLGAVIARVHEAVLILEQRDERRSQVTLMKTQMDTAWSDAERWKTEYLLRSARCQPDGFGKRYHTDHDEGGGGAVGLTS